jgi:SAM-dependent methyltransferase
VLHEAVKGVGFAGVEQMPFARKQPDGSWVYGSPGAEPLPDNSVDQVFSSHFLEHLTGGERVCFFNELWRVMKPGAQAQIITPNWAHSCAYGDPTHQWPPVSDFYVLYLGRAWREVNAPHTDYICNFDWATGGSWDPWLEVRHVDARMFAMQRYVNSLRDLYVTLVKRD